MERERSSLAPLVIAVLLALFAMMVLVAGGLFAARMLWINAAIKAAPKVILVDDPANAAPQEPKPDTAPADM